MNNKNAVIIMFSILLIVVTLCVSVSGLDYYKVDSCADLKFIHNATSLTVDKIKIVNGADIFGSSGAMTKTGLLFNYTLCDTDEHGLYRLYYHDNTNAVYTYDFYLTYSGNPKPSDFTTFGLFVIFLILMGSIVWVFLYTLSSFIDVDTSLLDVGYNVGLYFMFLTYIYFVYNYLDEVFIYNFLSNFVYIFAIVLIVLPLIAYFLTVAIRWQIKKEEARKW